MAKAARTPGGNAPQNQSQLQKQIDALQKQLGDKAPDAEAAKELQKDLDKLKDAAKAMADNASADARASQQQQLENMANELARKAEALGLPMPSLDEAVAALKGAQVDQFLKDLEIAEKDLEKMAEFSRQMAKLQQQAEKLGKDLAEQLKNGQAQAAIESLQRLQDLVKKSELTDAQKQQLSQEVQDAIKPGEQYGEVGEHLRQAFARMQSDDRTGTQQALAAAQSELEKLLNEMGDLQALMANLEGLRKAQMCVGNCQGWGSKPGRGGAGGKSGKPKGNRGFGDWADDSAWAMPDEIADSWDNTGLERTDKDGRGLTDRDSSVPDNVSATKLKGQIQPGGPMPSITLKGLSIKGESRVAYAEAVQSAQSDAQSALSQEQVPKAYRNSVRDYFDDLKQ
jgi:polyhydroxyalkanoate synthesis regulator phasin